MKRGLLGLLVGTATLALANAAAQAADLPARTAPVAPIAAVPVFTWAGFYVGVNAGYGWSDNDDDTVYVPTGTFAPSDRAASSAYIRFGDGDDGEGFLGGAQVGYNFQFGSFVVGVEADIQAADLSRDGSTVVAGADSGRIQLLTGPGFGGATFIRSGGGIDWFGTLRARLGFAFDRVLIYGTGGFAFGSGGDDVCSVGALINCDDDWRGGYALGAGVEYAITNNLTVGLEGLWVSLDHGNNRGIVFDRPSNTVYVSDHQDNDFGLVRAKLNFKF